MHGLHGDVTDALKCNKRINKGDVDKVLLLKKMLGPAAMGANWINSG